MVVVECSPAAGREPGESGPDPIWSEAFTAPRIQLVPKQVAHVPKRRPQIDRAIAVHGDAGIVAGRTIAGVEILRAVRKEDLRPVRKWAYRRIVGHDAGPVRLIVQRFEEPWFDAVLLKAPGARITIEEAHTTALEI